MTKLKDFPPTPELDKMFAAIEELGTHSIREFLEWCQEQRMQLCIYKDATPCPNEGKRFDKVGELLEQIYWTWRAGKQVPEYRCQDCGAEGRAGRTNHYDVSTAGFYPSGLSTEQLLAQYAGIDLRKVEDERRAVLAWIRVQHEKSNEREP